MKIGDSVVIGCDGWAYTTKQASAVRAVLEEMGLLVQFYPLKSKEEVIAFLCGQHSPASHIILICHGQGETEEGATMTFRCTSAQSTHFNSGHSDSQPMDGPETKALRVPRSYLILSPADVRDKVRTKEGGTLLCLACGVGKASFANAFLDAGYDAYIAPESGASSVTGAYWFITGFFHYLLAASWSEGNEQYTGAEAVQKASVNELTYRYYSR